MTILYEEIENNLFHFNSIEEIMSFSAGIKVLYKLKVIDVKTRDLIADILTVHSHTFGMREKGIYGKYHTAKTV